MPRYVIAVQDISCYGSGSHRSNDSHQLRLPRPPDGFDHVVQWTDSHSLWPSPLHLNLHRCLLQYSFGLLATLSRLQVWYTYSHPVYLGHLAMPFWARGRRGGAIFRWLGWLRWRLLQNNWPRGWPVSWEVPGRVQELNYTPLYMIPWHGSPGEFSRLSTTKWQQYVCAHTTFQGCSPFVVKPFGGITPLIQRSVDLNIP